MYMTNIIKRALIIDGETIIVGAEKIEDGEMPPCELESACLNRRTLFIPNDEYGSLKLKRSE